MKARCLIVDDEALARRLLADYVSKIPALELAGTCSNALEAQEVLQHQSVDILFLDIQMPDLTGIHLLQSLRQQPVTIFTTAYAEYALKGYELSVMDYLLKPISFERFFQAVTRALDYLAYQKEGPGKTETAPDLPAEQVSSKDYIFIKSDFRINKVLFSDILFIEAYGEYVRIYTTKERIMPLLSLGKIDEMLPHPPFMRVHRSYIINLDHLHSIQGNTLYLGDREVPLSKSYREEFMKRINGG